MGTYEGERIMKLARNYKGCLISLIGMVQCLLAALVMAVVSSCHTPKITEEHHHHYSQTDSVAVEAIMDSHFQQVREQMVRELMAKVTQQHTEQNTQEQEKERVTETITTWVDSLGRQMRQEQRTTERDISRQQQLREERMQQEWKSRLHTVTDSLNVAWMARIDSVAKHQEVNDSTSASAKPAPNDNRPWYRRLWDALKWMLAGALVAAVLWATRKFWSPWLRIFG